MMVSPPMHQPTTPPKKEASLGPVGTAEQVILGEASYTMLMSFTTLPRLYLIKPPYWVTAVLPGLMRIVVTPSPTMTPLNALPSEAPPKPAHLLPSTISFSALSSVTEIL